MSYSNKYDPARYLPIQGIIERIRDIGPGEKVIVEGSSLNRESLSRIRQLLYDWLSHMGTKGDYKIRVDWDDMRLIIRNTRVSENLRISVEKTKASSWMEEYVQKLIQEGGDRDKAWEIIQKWVGEEKLTISEGSEILSLYLRVME